MLRTARPQFPYYNFITTTTPIPKRKRNMPRDLDYDAAPPMSHRNLNMSDWARGGDGSFSDDDDDSDDDTFADEDINEDEVNEISVDDR